MMESLSTNQLGDFVKFLCPLVRLAKPSSKGPFKVRKVHIFLEGHKNMMQSHLSLINVWIMSFGQSVK